MADKVLCQAVQGISAIITETGFHNVDFADVETVMRGKGDALMGIGYGSGENRAQEAVKNAIDNPLLEDTCIDGATGVLIDINAPHDITMVEINNIIKSIKEKCDPEVHLIFGFRTDVRLEDSVQVTVIATGFPGEVSTSVNTPSAQNISNVEFIDINEYEGMIRRTSKPGYLTYLPHRGEFEDDLEVPSVIRNYNFMTEEKTAVVQGY
jgi:cell division protein FtsZ